MNDSTPILQVEQLGHVYRTRNGPINVFENICFSVKGSEILVVRGESGSGKTTLLLACGAMQRPTLGNVLISGSNLYELSSSERNRYRAVNIGYLFQTLELVPYLNLLDNVRVSHAASPSDAKDWLQRLGLGNRLWFKPESLSHGQRQRAALCRALVHRPRLVIADEPTGNLDESHSQVVFQTLREFADRGNAVLIATHNSAAVEYADQVLEIENN